MHRYDYALVDPIGAHGALGLIALQADETIEADMRAMFPDPEVALYVSRVPSGEEVTRESLASMGPRLEDAARLLPPSRDFAAVGYGCTSGTSVIGSDAVAAAVRAGCAAAAVTEPLSALLAACAALGVGRLAFLSPYIADVSAGLRDALAAKGVTSPVVGTFDEAVEARVARIDPQSIHDAALDLAAQDTGTDAIFLSCTNLRTLDIIAPLEAATGKPVLSSNQVLAWHMAGLAGVPAKIPGRLGAVRRTA